VQDETLLAPVAAYGADVRQRFMTRVYLRLLAGVAAFVALETFLFTSGLAVAITRAVVSTSWLLVLGGFMLVSWLATSLGARATSPAAGLAGFALLVAANAVVFAPLLVLAEFQVPGVIGDAARVSIAGFVGLSVVAHRSSRDWTFLGAALRWMGVLALVAIVAAVLLGTGLGTWFSVAMIGLAGAAILHDTQAIMRSYPPDRETAAAMQLFSSLALLFWYVVRLLSRR
jgi:uncharacterized protein